LSRCGLVPARPATSLSRLAARRAGPGDRCSPRGACSAARQTALSRRRCRGAARSLRARRGRQRKEHAMAGMRLGTLVLVLLLALAPQPTRAQAPGAAPPPLINLFADDTIAYLEIALRA